MWLKWRWDVTWDSAAWRKGWVNGGLCEGLKLVGSTTVHLHGLPGKQQTDVPMEVDLPRLRTLEPEKAEGRWEGWEILTVLVYATHKREIQLTSDEWGSARCVRGRGTSCCSDCLRRGGREQRKSSGVGRSGVQLAWLAGHTSQQTSSPLSCWG